jgi:hypothetical protein
MALEAVLLLTAASVEVTTWVVLMMVAARVAEVPREPDGTVREPPVTAMVPPVVGMVVAVPSGVHEQSEFAFHDPRRMCVPTPEQVLVPNMKNVS